MTLLITNAHVVDVRTGSIEAADVWCADGRFRGVGPGQEPDATVAATLDARGGFVVPGLIDAHVHVAAVDVDLGVNDRMSPSLVAALAARTMREMLGRGFTSVRDMGGADLGLVEAQRRGLFPGPRIFHAGRALSQTGGHGDFRSAGDDAAPSHGHGIGRVVDGVDAVQRAARDEIRKGARHIKIMASGGVASPTDRIDSTQFSVEEIRAAVEEAAAANVYVAAHAYTAAAVNRCLENGVHSIEHGNLLDARSVELLLEHGAFLVPTLVTYAALEREGRRYGQSERSHRKVSTVLQGGLEALERADRAGVSVAFGTDLLGEMHHHQNEEFRHRADVQPPLAVLQSATLVGARLLGLEGELGEVTPGARADLLILDADPLADVGVLADPARHLRAVVQAGRVVVENRAAPPQKRSRA